MDVKKFQKLIWDFYKKSRRDFPWRETTDPYKILVSEIMLQQTQTFRVLPKYKEFIKAFPDFLTLAKSPLSKILKVWSGLGYNRRALYLKKTAELILKEHAGKLPLDPKILQTFPGIGPNTAGAIYVFSTNKPYVFIETNIRRVFIYHFFADPSCHPELARLAESKRVSGSHSLTVKTRFRNKFGMTERPSKPIHDKELFPIIEKTLCRENPRNWYYALMDYGAYLGKTQPNPNRKSRHYTKQSKFEGSLRQIRGQILKLLTSSSMIQIIELKEKIKTDEKKFEKALMQLQNEGFIEIRNKIVLTSK